MHSLFYLAQGLGIGLLISVSVGPVALLTIQRTAQFGLRAGMISAFTIAVIDTLAAVLVLLGIHAYLPLLTLPRKFHALGTLAILIYGVYLFFRKEQVVSLAIHPVQKHVWDTFLISFTNPSTYISFGVIALLCTRFVHSSLFDRIELSIGFFIGAIAWWLTLVRLAFTHKEWLNVPRLQKVVALLIIILALGTLLLPQYSGHFSLLRILFTL